MSRPANDVRRLGTTGAGLIGNKLSGLARYSGEVRIVDQLRSLVTCATASGPGSAPHAHPGHCRRQRPRNEAPCTVMRFAAYVARVSANYQASLSSLGYWRAWPMRTALPPPRDRAPKPTRRRLHRATNRSAQGRSLLGRSGTLDWVANGVPEQSGPTRNLPDP